MPAIVEFPQVVREAIDEFGGVFSCDPQRRHFAEYLTGLMVAANQTITGINGESVETADQSCLNRFLTAVEWDEAAVNQRRLELMQRDPTTTGRHGKSVALCTPIELAGRARKPIIGMVSSSLEWEIVSFATAKVSPGICTW
jgi:hypothetical protein